MLVLGRNLGESIVIDDKTEVEVVEIRGSQVKLGITAPRSIPVVRKELISRKHKEVDNEKGQSDVLWQCQRLSNRKINND